MLERLDDVDWSRLRTAYGPLLSVPQEIRDLASPDAAVRERASKALYGNIFHQGTRYEAAVPAIPAFFELLANRSTPDRAGLVDRLIALALGYLETYLPIGLDAGEFTQALEKELADYPDGVDTYGRGPAVDLACYRAVNTGASHFFDLLHEPEPWMRQAGASALGWLPEHAPGSIPALQRLAMEDSEPAVIADALISLGLLARNTEVTLDTGLLHQMLDHSQLVVRAAAASALAAKPLVTRVVDVMVEGLAGLQYVEGERPALFFETSDTEIRSYLSQLLSAMTEPGSEPVLRALCGVLPNVDWLSLQGVTYAILNLVGTRPPEGQPLTAYQQLGLRALASNTLWQPPGPTLDFTNIFRTYGYPDRHKQLIDYLESHSGT